ncbi:MAG: hypothetical protein A2V93_00980 [Ignavibacteria bacterium RBG_16_34_14]|nr:MAG: hypothetical protein A2V93_00980 [Ignavibacteria bacterium RBG_16_34_14]
MKIKKEYTFSNNKQIWRLLPSETGKLVIEERDPEAKEVFFSCIEINSGNKIFNKLFIEEKFWIGIEKIYKNTIFFHRFRKPDMPGHIGIIAFDILSKNILWRNDDYIFLFIYNDELYCFKERFEGRNYFKLNYKTGELLENVGENAVEISTLREKILDEENPEGYYFTKQFFPETEGNEKVKKFLFEERNQNLISGKIDYILLQNLLFFSFHQIQPSGDEMKNIFKAVDIDKGKVIFEEELNRGVKNFVPDSFFIKDDLLFLLKEKTELLVCSIKK